MDINIIGAIEFKCDIPIYFISLSYSGSIFLIQWYLTNQKTRPAFLSFHHLSLSFCQLLTSNS